MAKADVTLKFDAQTNEYVQACLKARDASLQGANGARKFGEDAVKGSNAATEAMKGAGGQLISYFGVVTSVGAAAALAVKLTIKSAEEYMDRIEKRADGLRQKVNTLSESMSGAGNLNRYTEVAAKIKAMSGQSYGGIPTSGGELTKVYASVQNQFRDKISDPSVILKSVEEYQKARGAGLSEEDALGVASKRAMLHPLGLDSMAYSAFKGGLDETDMRTVYRSKNKEQALRMVLASKQVDEGPRALLAIQGEADHRNKSIDEIINHPEYFHKDPKMFSAVKNLARGMAGITGEITTDQLLARNSAVSDPDLNARRHEISMDVREKRASATGSSRARDVSDWATEYRTQLREISPNAPDWALNFLASGERVSTGLGVTSPGHPTANAIGDKIHSVLVSIERKLFSGSSNTALKNNSEGQK